MRKQLIITLVFLGLALPLGQARADDFSEGLNAHNEGDYSTALRIWSALAEQGDANAQYNLGVMYGKGRGVPQDAAEAVKWYRLATEQGVAEAQTNLGVMYGIGEGVIQSNVIAHMLANLASAQGHKNGQKLRDAISERMTPNNISRAQEMARVCLERNYKGCGF